MQSIPHAENVKRLEVLRSFDVLDSAPEKSYDELTRLTAELCEAPVCLISLVEKDRQWFKSEVGLGICETHIEQSICSHAVAQDNYLEIGDTVLDPRTVDNPLCMGKKPFRFYAGALIRSLDNWPLGTLCVLDYKPRRLSAQQQQILRVHAKSVAHQLELTRVLIKSVKSATRKTPKTSVNASILKRIDSLTPRETEIVQLIGSGSASLSSKKIARELNTVSYTHLTLPTKA